MTESHHRLDRERPLVRLFEIADAFPLKGKGTCLTPVGSVFVSGVSIGDEVELWTKDGRRIAIARVVDVERPDADSMQVTALWVDHQASPRDKLTGHVAWSPTTSAVARQWSLDRECALCLGLEDLRIGSHTLRRDDRVKVGTVLVHRIWRAEFRPSFHEHGGLVVAYTDHGTRAVLRTMPDDPIADVRPQPALLVDWADPVLDLLAAVTLVPTKFSPPDLFLDGIGYVLRVQTEDLTLDIDFSNPTRPPALDLERAIFDAARVVAAAQGDENARSYPEELAMYLERDERNQP